MGRELLADMLQDLRFRLWQLPDYQRSITLPQKIFHGLTSDMRHCGVIVGFGQGFPRIFQDTGQYIFRETLYSIFYCWKASRSHIYNELLSNPLKQC